MRDFLKYFRRHWGRMLLAMLAIAVATLCDLLLPTVMGWILDNGVEQADMGYIVRCCLGMLGIALVSVAGTLAGARLSNNVVAAFCAEVRRDVFDKVNHMSFEEFGTLGTAALVTRATTDVQTVSWVASMFAGTVVTIPLLFFGGVVLAMRKDVQLSLVMLAAVPFIVALVLIVGRKIRPLWELSDKYIDRQNELMRQRLRGIRVIRAFNAEGVEHEKIAQATRVMAENIIISNTSMGLITPLASFLMNAAVVIIVYLGGARMHSGSSLTGGDIFAMIQYIGLVSSGVIMSAFSVVMFPHAKVAAQRIGQVLHSRGMADPVERQQLHLSGDIVFEHVSFAYEGAAEAAVQDVSLHIHPGQKVAFIGSTGSGKSTLVNMLLGFRMPTGGQILLDGIPTAQLSRYTMRENISCVLQNTALYSGTIRENVEMGRHGATDAQIRQALEVAQAAEFVDGLDAGVDHVLTQSGKNLSGGQKQRLGIARAVLKDAPIYVFDDSFSALDFLTEARLRRALAQRIAEKTQVVITQRVSSAMHADCIYVMEQGRLVDSGTHGELLRRCGVYREIYASQTGGAAE